MKIMLFAIPVFFILIGLELLIARLRKTQLYRLNDALTNINCGVVQQITGVFSKTFMIGLYVWIYDNWRIPSLEIPDTWWSYTLLFIGVDFFYYLFHRYSHEISLLWGTHIVHHQSEEYNLSVALRQSAIQGFASIFFYLPLALIGFRPELFVLMNTLQTLYQFWIHTRLIGKMPAWFEFVFNTPSHHRVHHGINPEYLDKNHGGTLIIFDRMFGTFQEERAEVVYGVTKPLASWNPVWANFDYYKDLWHKVCQTRSLWDAFKVIFKGPGWSPAYLKTEYEEESSPYDQVKFDPRFSFPLHVYVFVQFVVLLGISVFFLSGGDQMKAENYAGVVLVVLLISLGAANLGLLMENKRYAVWLEILKFTAFIGIAWYLFNNHSVFIYLMAGVIGLATISIIWLMYIRSDGNQYRLQDN